MSFIKKSLCFLLVAHLLLVNTEAVPNRGGSYNEYSAGAAGGAYAQSSGGSFETHNNNRPNNYNPRPSHSSGYSKGGVQAEGGFVAGGGSVSAGYDKGYNQGHRG